MKKSIIPFISIATVLMFGGCTQQPEIELPTISQSGEEKPSETKVDSGDESQKETESTEYYIPSYSAAGGCNAEFLSESGNWIMVGGDTVKMTEAGIDIRVHSFAEISEADTEFPVDVYVFCDGAVIKQTNEQGELVDYTTFNMKNTMEIETVGEIHIPADKIYEQDFSCFSIVCNQFPGYKAETSKMAFCTVSTVNLRVDTSDYKSTTGDEHDYVIADKDDYCTIGEDAFDEPINFRQVDLGESIQKNGRFYTVFPMQATVELGQPSLFAKVTYDYGYDGRLYAALFCDGRLVKAFDGKTFLQFQAENETQSLNYCLDLNDIEIGEHMLQLIVYRSSDNVPEEEIGYDYFSATDNRLFVVTE